MTRPRTVFRQLDGILLLDKPAGMSSNQALQRVRHLFRAEKAGHTGSLDPLATGLLPVCFGEATKIAGYLLGSDKAYEVEAKLGATTDTDDADGQVLVERAIPSVSRDELVSLLSRFLGRIRQRPPIYSALKQGGEPLYAKARRGEAIEVPEREVEVRKVELLDFDRDTLRLQVECGTGTYIRSIVRDLGEALGCGAHVTQLRRLWVSPFRTPQMHSLAALQRLRETNDEAGLDALLLPVEAGLVAWPRLQLDQARAQALGHGQPLRLEAGEQAAFEKAHSGPFEALAVGPGALALGLVEVGDDGFVRAKRLFRWAAAGEGRG